LTRLSPYQPILFCGRISIASYQELRYWLKHQTAAALWKPAPESTLWSLSLDRLLRSRHTFYPPTKGCMFDFWTPAQRNRNSTTHTNQYARQMLLQKWSRR
jgi:hypothetical protein